MSKKSVKLALPWTSDTFSISGWISLSLLLPLLGLCVAIGTSPSHLVYDEVYHVPLAERVANEGWLAALTSVENDSAAGPAYPAVHLMASPATALAAPAIRFVNLAIFVGLLFVLSKWLAPMFPAGRYAPLALLGIPFIWPPLGIALTEIIALFLYSLHCWTLASIFRQPANHRHQMAMSVLAGALLGFTILARQTYLVAFGPIVAIGLLQNDRRGQIAVTILTATAASAWLFYLWGGLVAPSQAHVSGPLRVDHGVLGLSYLGTAMLILSPRFYKDLDLREWLAISSLALLTAILLAIDSPPPAKTLLVRTWGEPASAMIGLAIRTPMFVLGFAWLWTTCKLAWRVRKQVYPFWVHLSGLSLSLIPVKITHTFSSRYLVGAVVILLLQALPTMQISAWLSARVILGASAGAWILNSYYNSAAGH